MAKYNAKAVQEAIARDASIGRQEARLIHALLKGSGRTAPLNCAVCGAPITLRPDDTTHDGCTLDVFFGVTE